MTAPAFDPLLDAQLEDLDSIKQRALGQRDAVRDHVEDALSVLNELRLQTQQLASIHRTAVSRLDRVPGFDAELPDDVEGYADLDLPKIVRDLLGVVNGDRLAELRAGIDSAEGALRRYRERVETEYETHHGDLGWRPADKILATSVRRWSPDPAVSDALQAVLDGKCPVPGCGREEHGFIRAGDDGEFEHVARNLVTVEVYVRGKSAVHLAGPSESGGTGPCICGFDRHAQGVGFSVGGGVTGPGVEHDVCAECAALVGDSTVSGTHAALFRKDSDRG